MITVEEKELLRELAKQYREIAQRDTNAERIARLTAVNDLHTGLRPAVWIYELPWHELDIDKELALRCTDPFARAMEQQFRRMLFRFKHFEADTIAPMYYEISKSYEATGNGLEVHENIISMDNQNNIVSHEYIDQLATEKDLERLKTSVIIPHPEEDEKNAALAIDILGDILPVRLSGTQIYYAPWDQIPRYRGVEPIFFDMVDRPEFLHKIIKKFTENQDATMTQLEEFGLLEGRLIELHCTPALTSALPLPDYSEKKTRLKDVWFRGMAQMFASVSPDMQEEFDLQYMRPLMERCGLVYYGCCEPLDNKISMLKKIPNMRKIGVSPWAKLESSAEQIGSDYVFARKPNPAFVADVFDEETVRKEIIQTVETCLKYNCPYEFVLKDISTVSYKPQNIIGWNRVVTEILDSYYK